MLCHRRIAPGFWAEPCPRPPPCRPRPPPPPRGPPGGGTPPLACPAPAGRAVPQASHSAASRASHSAHATNSASWPGGIAARRNLGGPATVSLALTWPLPAFFIICLDGLEIVHGASSIVGRSAWIPFKQGDGLFLHFVIPSTPSGGMGKVSLVHTCCHSCAESGSRDMWGLKPHLKLTLRRGPRGCWQRAQTWSSDASAAAVARGNSTRLRHSGLPARDATHPALRGALKSVRLLDCQLCCSPWRGSMQWRS